jgi:glycosyltransferase involved in cell wall biosynthesis
MKHLTLSIILPTYNESANIIKVIQSIHNTCKNASHEIIVVDDHSPDNTKELTQRHFKNASWLRLFSHPGKRSLGASIGFGISQARGTIIVGMDADGNHNPKNIPRLLKGITTTDVVVGSRFLPSGGMHESLRYWTSYLFNLLLRACFGFPITDNTSGFYAIRATTVRRLIKHYPQIYTGYGDYHLRLVWYATEEGLTIRERAVYYGKRHGGQSKSIARSMIWTYLHTAMQLTQKS